MNQPDPYVCRTCESDKYTKLKIPPGLWFTEGKPWTKARTHCSFCNTDQCIIYDLTNPRWSEVLTTDNNESSNQTQGDYVD